MMHRPWMTGALCAVLFTVMVAVGAAAGEPPAPLYRLFLTDGTSVAAYGEWVRVGDRVVFTVAVGDAAHAVMHLASLPAERVDWPATERYRDGLRAASYAATRGDTDFAELADIVARLLSDASLAADPVRKLALADEARRRLVEWPAAHYGYRADEVRQILVLVDEVVSGLRAARDPKTRASMRGPSSSAKSGWVWGSSGSSSGSGGSGGGWGGGGSSGGFGGGSSGGGGASGRW